MQTVNWNISLFASYATIDSKSPSSVVLRWAINSHKFFTTSHESFLHCIIIDKNPFKIWFRTNQYMLNLYSGPFVPYKYNMCIICSKTHDVVKSLSTMWKANFLALYNIFLVVVVLNLILNKLAIALVLMLRLFLMFSYNYQRTSHFWIF